MKSELTVNDLIEWETKLDTLVAEIRRVNNRDVLYDTYKRLLAKNAPISLDILQMSVFDRIASAVVDSLIRIHPKEAPITAVVDELTEIHLEYIETFRTIIDDGVSCIRL
jgi:hypothetical protein